MTQFATILGDTTPVPTTVTADQAQTSTLPGFLTVQRGYYAVPSEDVRAYVREESLTLVAGIAIGIVAAGLFGFTKQKLTAAVKAGNLEDYPSEPTKGWHRAEPARKSQREALRASCGRRCFLDPDRLKYPICRKCSGNTCSCQPDCRGLLAALQRVDNPLSRLSSQQQLAYRGRVKSLARSQGCHWVERRG